MSTNIIHTPNLPEGYEDVTKDDLVIPRAKLVQSTSAEAKSGLRKPGDIVNNITGEILPSDFTPFVFFKTWLRWNPRNKSSAGFDPEHAPGALIWRTNDKDDPRVIEGAKFGADGEAPLVTAYLNFLSVFDGLPFPIIVPFAKTSYGTGKQLLSMARWNGDLYRKKYRLSAKQKTNDQGDYYTFEVTIVGDADNLPRLVEMRNQYADKKNLMTTQEDSEDATSEPRPY